MTDKPVKSIALEFPSLDEAQPIQAGTVQEPSSREAPTNTGLEPPPNFDTRRQSIALPSSFAFYDFKTAFLRFLTPRDQFSLYRGQVNKTVRNTVEVVSACMHQDAYKLTIGDFHYVLYELRIHSYTKAPMTVSWICTADQHLLDVEAKKKTPESVQQRSRLTSSDLVITQLTPERIEEAEALRASILEEFKFHVRPTLVADWVTSVETLEEQPIEDRAVIEYMDGYATLLDDRHGTLAERRELIVNAESPDLLSDLDRYSELTDHGVSEFFNVKCKECGTTERVRHALDVPHFFPVSQARDST